MVAPFPKIEPRELKDLRAALGRAAAKLVPALSRPAPKGEFGAAFYEIAARMAAEVTGRLEGVPRRDAVAFFDALDIPPMAPQAAKAPVVFTLTDKAETSVVAPKRTQVGADDKHGEVVFETLEELEISPARLTRLVAVDVETDRIEEGPTGVLLAEPRAGTFPRYRVVTFATQGTATVQIAPIIGLEKGDIIRIGEAPDAPVYAISGIERDLCTLEPLLEAPADAGTVVRKVTRFEAFQLRNAQAHQVYIGHKELLNLKQKARITLTVEPVSTQRVLADMSLRLDLWSIKPTNEDPAWNPLELESAGANGLVFSKDWLGDVAEKKVLEEKSRWLRLVLVDPIPNRSTTDTRIESLKLKVESLQAKDSSEASASKPTVEKAFHNATPLSVSTQFQPFGAEPQRFDTFALSASEALSKKGASVTLAVGLLDATPAALTMASIYSGPPRAYGISGNGQLQAIALDADLQWLSIPPPTTAQLSNGIAAGSDRSLALSSEGVLQAVEAATPLTDLVIAQDEDNRLWSLSIVKQGNGGAFLPGAWTLLHPTEASDQATTNEAVLLRAGNDHVVVAFSKAGARFRRIGADGAPSGAWTNISSIWAPTDAPGELDGKIAIARVENHPYLFSPAEIIRWCTFPGHCLTRHRADRCAGDRMDRLGFGKTPTTAVSATVRPAAAYSNGRIVVAAADRTDEAGTNNRLFALRGDQWNALEKTLPPETIIVLEGTALQCFPTPFIPGARHAAVAAVTAEAGSRKAVVWTDDETLSTKVLPIGPGGTTASGVFVWGANAADPPMLIASALGERVVRFTLQPDEKSVDVDLFDAVRFPGAGVVPDFAVLDSHDLTKAAVRELPSSVIEFGNARYLPLQAGSLTAVSQ